MAFKYEVYKTQRVCMLRFKRKIEGEPIFEFPDVDNRGSFRRYTDGNFDRGPVVPVMQDDDIHIEILRERIDKSAPLFATSSDEATMTVSNKNQLAADYSMGLRLTGVHGSGGTLPRKASLQIRYGSPTGVVIGELGVWVFTKMSVNLTPHLVSIQNAAGVNIASAVNIPAVIAMVKAIWRPYGVVITDAPVQKNPPLTFAVAGEIAWKSEFNTLLRTNWVPGTINAYFVNRIKFFNDGVLGVGLSRSLVGGDAGDPIPLPNPGILLGDQSRNGINRATDIHYLANDLAHEIGHFLQLAHIDKRSPDGTAANADNFRDDTWSRRCLMHNFNNTFFTSTPPPGSPPDVGYGGSYRGSLITLKDLTDADSPTVNHITDPEYRTARDTINSSAGPY